MTDKLYDTTQISRRKVLGGMGAIGLAAAGAGLGTSAFFSDREDFNGNSLVAGSLDMKVDWEEHYSDWSDDETAYARMPVGDEEADYVLPALAPNGVLMSDARPIELVFDGETIGEKQDAKDGLWDATSIEAYPDGFTNGGEQDGIQDDFDEALSCTILTDVGDGDPGLSSRLRTEGTFAGQTTESGDPLINIADVKPGDFGEVTLSFHICDNPGYVWLNGELVSAAENGHTEPEADDPDEVGGPDSVDPADVELLDYIATRIWYDPNGNNQVDVLGGELDIMLAVDASGSIEGDKTVSGTEANNLVAGVQAFVDALPDNGNVQVGQLLFGRNSGISDFTGLTNPGSLPDMGTIYPNSGRGNTPMPAALDIADQELDANGRASAQQIIVTFTDGGPNYNNTQFSAGGYTAPRGSPDETGFSDDDSNDQYDAGSNGTTSDAEAAETAAVAEAIRDSGSRIVAVNVADNPNTTQGNMTTTLRDYLTTEVASSGFYFEIDLANLEDVAEDLVAGVAVPEEVFFQGSLREALSLLAANDGRGIPLDGDRETAFDEVSDPENSPDRDCFAGEGTTHYVALQWWLPINHANQVQTDSVSFDLGFYTEQCRHNDGAGMVPEDEAEEFTTVEQTA